MKRILGDFRRAHATVPVGSGITALLCVGGMALGGVFSGKFMIPAIIISVYLIGVLVWSMIDVFLLGPSAFKKMMAELPGEEQAAVLDGYATAVKLGDHRFYAEKRLMTYCRRRIVLLNYEDIIVARLVGVSLEVTTSDERRYRLRTGSEHNAALLAAALKSKNDKLSVTR